MVELAKLLNNKVVPFLTEENRKVVLRSLASLFAAIGALLFQLSRGGVDGVTLQVLLESVLAFALLWGGAEVGNDIRKNLQEK